MNLFQTIIGTLKGVDNEGSSKRATAFGFFTLVSYLTIIYGAMYVYVVIWGSSDSEIHKGVEALMWPMVGTVVSSVVSSLTLTTWEKRSNNKKDVELKKAEVSQVKNQ